MEYGVIFGIYHEFPFLDVCLIIFKLLGDGFVCQSVNHLICTYFLTTCDLQDENLIWEQQIVIHIGILVGVKVCTTEDLLIITAFVRFPSVQELFWVGVGFLGCVWVFGGGFRFYGMGVGS